MELQEFIDKSTNRTDPWYRWRYLLDKQDFEAQKVSDLEGKYLRIKVRLAGPANKTEVDPEEDEDRWDVQTSRFRRYLRG